MELSKQDIERYLTIRGKQGALKLSHLGKVGYFLEALNTDIGKQLLYDFVNQYEILCRQILDGTDKSDNAYVKKDVLEQWLDKCSQKIDNYNKSILDIKETIGKS